MNPADYETLHAALLKAFEHEAAFTRITETLGLKIYRDYGSRDLSQRDNYFRFLDMIISRGDRDLAIFMRRCCIKHPELRAVAARCVPDFDAITDIEVAADVIEKAFAEGLPKEKLAVIAGQLNGLTSYKGMHHLLHEFQIEATTVLFVDLADVASQSDRAEEVEGVAKNTSSIAERARFLVDYLPIGRRSEDIAWIDDIEAIALKLGEAARKTDVPALRQQVLRVRQVLRRAPVLMDARLQELTRALPFQELVQILNARGAQQTGQFHTAVRELERIAAELASAAESHRRWQQLDGVLIQIDELLAPSVADLAYLALVWSEARTQMSELFEPHSISAELQANLAIVDAAATGQLQDVRRAYARCRMDLLKRFVAVDRALKEKCGDILFIGKVVDGLLEEAA